jgi:hypothetical protein
MANKKPLVLTSNRPTEHDGSADTLAAGGPITCTDLTPTGTVDVGGATSLEVPNGAGGTTVNAAGEVTVDTTSNTFNYYDGSTEQVLQPVRTAAITIKDPDTTVDFVVFRTNYAITISEIEVVLRGTTPSVTWSLMHNTDRSAAGNTIDSNTTTNTTTGDVHTTLTDATVPADSFIWVEISAESGTTDEMHLSFDFTQDA